MQLKLTSVFVNDQDKALKFYTEVLGFQKKHEFPGGEAQMAHRGLSRRTRRHATGSGAQQGPQPAAKSYQQQIFQQGIPAANFFVADVQKEYERLTKLGVNFTKEPTKVTGSTIAVLDDTCGNLIQITHLDW